MDCLHKPLKNVKTYDRWLCTSLGNYFAKNFSFVYNQKYWGVEPKELETEWICSRVHVPNIKEVLAGAFEENHKNFSYVGNQVFYPKIGGFRCFLDKCRKDLMVNCCEKIVKIIPKKQKIIFEDGREETYDCLISSIPLPEIVKMIQNCPQEVLNAGDNMHWTQGYLVSLGFKRLVRANFWCFYIYDKQILPARAYFPNLESAENVPNECSSLQAEVYWDCKQEKPDAQWVLDQTIQNVKKICGFCEKDLILKDIRWEPYANVTFTHGTYDNRQIVIDYLHSLNIETIGRFGEWDYLWSDQAFESGRKICNKISLKK